MEKYFLGICIVIASLIYVWGNKWEVLDFKKEKNIIIAIKYNRITGETKYSMGTGGWETLPDLEK
tara:strand:+ start:776 stop:970 length:195 start_codon:yes stop_codon:yes gene_type:complete